MNLDVIRPDESMLAAMAQIEQLAHPYPWSEKQLASCFGERYVNGLLLLNDVPVGFYISDMILDESTLMNICIAPEYRGRGLGKYLLEDFLKQTQSMGCSLWFLEVRASNQTARQMYLQHGFQEDGVRKGYYQTNAEREDAILMSKSE